MPQFSNLSLALPPDPGHSLLKTLGSPPHSPRHGSGASFLEEEKHVSEWFRHQWIGKSCQPQVWSIPLPCQVPHYCGCTVLALQVASGSLSGPARLAPQLGQDFWTLTPGLDSRDCPSQWTCIFPRVLFLHPVVLPADYQPHPCPHPPLCGLLIGAQTQITLLILPTGRPTTPLFPDTGSPLEFGAG